MVRSGTTRTKTAHDVVPAVSVFTGKRTGCVQSSVCRAAGHMSVRHTRVNTDCNYQPGRFPATRQHTLHSPVFIDWSYCWFHFTSRRPLTPRRLKLLVTGVRRQHRSEVRAGDECVLPPWHHCSCFSNFLLVCVGVSLVWLVDGQWTGQETHRQVWRQVSRSTQVRGVDLQLTSVDQSSEVRFHLSSVCLSLFMNWGWLLLCPVMSVAGQRMLRGPSCYYGNHITTSASRSQLSFFLLLWCFFFCSFYICSFSSAISRLTFFSFSFYCSSFTLCFPIFFLPFFAFFCFSFISPFFLSVLVLISSVILSFVNRFIILFLVSFSFIISFLLFL